MVLNFYDKIIVVAITVSSNGFIVGMNPKGWTDWQRMPELWIY
jgi:hypothetical protein